VARVPIENRYEKRLEGIEAWEVDALSTEINKRGVGLDECEAKLPKESWLPAWRRGGYAAVQEAEMDAAHECCVRSIGLGAGVGATFDDPCAPAPPMSREERKRVAAEAEEEAKRQAESEDDPLAGLAIEEDTAPPRRKTRTKSKSTHRQDKRPMPMGAHPDDPLGDVLPGL
jgi:hypothetical protein